ncbi:MAG: phosphotransferase [Solirubrobacteraceae bacterium]
MATTTNDSLTAGPAPAFTPPSKRWALVRTGEVLASGVRERVSRTHAVGAADVPRSPDEITPEWLTAVLCAGTPGARVLTATAPGGSIGTTTRKSLYVTYNDAGDAAGLPAFLFAKCTTALMQRLVLGLGGFIDGEPGFYNYVRPALRIEAPHGYYGRVDPGSWRSVVLMEDVAATRGATFWRPSTKITRSRIEDLLANMAVWHGTYWDNPKLRELKWLKTPTDHLRVIDSLIGMEKRSLVGAERGRSVIPPALRDRQRDLYLGMGRSLELSSRAPHTYLHGDLHVGNTYVTDSGAMGIGDWQIGLRGGWAYDFAYLVASALDVEDRRSWEHELLDFYLERLAAAGGAIFTRDDAWQAYRQATFYPYFAWVYTIGRARLQPKFQPDEISLPVIERTAAAIDDLESLAAVGL